MLEPYRGQTVVAGRAAACWGPISRSLGVASATAGKLDRAVEELEDGIALSERMGDRPFLAQAHLNLAHVLLDRNSRGDHERALELLDRCLDAAQEMGMRALTDQALAAKLAAQGLAGVDATTSIDEVIAAVESERPDILAYAAPDGTVTILFSDIEDSTILTERLGDERWLDLLRSHNSIFRQHPARARRLRGQEPGRRLHARLPRASRGPALRDRGPAGARGARQREPRRWDPGADGPAHRRGDRRGGRLLRPQRRPRRPHRGSGAGRRESSSPRRCASRRRARMGSPSTRAASWS